MLLWMCCICFFFWLIVNINFGCNWCIDLINLWVCVNELILWENKIILLVVGCCRWRILVWYKWVFFRFSISGLIVMDRVIFELSVSIWFEWECLVEFERIMWWYFDWLYGYNCGNEVFLWVLYLECYEYKCICVGNLCYFYDLSFFFYYRVIGYGLIFNFCLGVFGLDFCCRFFWLYVVYGILSWVVFWFWCKFGYGVNLMGFDRNWIESWCFLVSLILVSVVVVYFVVII